jgi:hypothetical protein
MMRGYVEMLTNNEIREYRAYVRQWPGYWEVLKPTLRSPNPISQLQGAYSVHAIYRPKTPGISIFMVHGSGATAYEAQQQIDEMIHTLTDGVEREVRTNP